MTRPRLLDLFAGAGGSAVGYHRAGFDVVGVDIRPQPNYPYEFVEADALEYLADPYEDWERWDAIHASPPCQAFTSMQSVARNGDAHPDLIASTRELLQATGLPYVIENVPGAPLHEPFMLCGSMFGLGVQSLRADTLTPFRQLRRHRIFETNWDIGMLHPCAHRGKALGIYGDHLRLGRRSSDGEYSGATALALGKLAMGIDWTVTWAELKEAIPPVYCEFIGHQLLAHLNTRAAAGAGETT